MALDNTEKTLHELDKAPKTGKGGRVRNKTKPDRFLNAIKKYAREQKNAMRTEVNQLKTERLQQAEENARRDSEKLIREKLEEARSRETVILASKTKEGQKKLFIARSEMVEDVFERAAQKLVAYTATDAYAEKLLKSAEEIAALFGDNDCTVYLREEDLAKADEIKALFSGAVTVEKDDSIRIGGIKGSCGSLHIIADETLDSKLRAQREWFIENADLSVL